MVTPVYVSLDYEQYKAFERQFEQGIGPLETTHSRDDERFYHKAIRFRIGDLTFEVTGPGVMAPPTTVCPLCNQLSPNGEVHTECADREQMQADEGPHR